MVSKNTRPTQVCSRDRNATQTIPGPLIHSFGWCFRPAPILRCDAMPASCLELPRWLDGGDFRRGFLPDGAVPTLFGPRSGGATTNLHNRRAWLRKQSVWRLSTLCKRTVLPFPPLLSEISRDWALAILARVDPTCQGSGVQRLQMHAPPCIHPCRVY